MPIPLYKEQKMSKILLLILLMTPGCGVDIIQVLANNDKKTTQVNNFNNQVNSEVSAEFAKLHLEAGTYLVIFENQTLSTIVTALINKYKGELVVGYPSIAAAQQAAADAGYSANVYKVYDSNGNVVFTNN